ncbi:hypothetical protein T484DRAFT_1882634, partial [Baffinella frigidus]
MRSSRHAIMLALLLALGRGARGIFTFPEGLADISGAGVGGVAYASAGEGDAGLVLDGRFDTAWRGGGTGSADLEGAAIAIVFRQIFSVAYVRVTCGASSGGRGITRFRLSFAATLPENRTGDVNMLAEKHWRTVPGLRVAEGQDDELDVVQGQVLTRRVDNFLRIDPPIAARAIRIMVEDTVDESLAFSLDEVQAFAFSRDNPGVLSPSGQEYPARGYIPALYSL